MKYAIEVYNAFVEVANYVWPIISKFCIVACVIALYQIRAAIREQTEWLKADDIETERQ